MTRRKIVLLAIAILTWTANIKADNNAEKDSVWQVIVEKSAESLGIPVKQLINIEPGRNGDYVLVRYAYELANKKKETYEVGVALLARNTFAPVWRKTGFKADVTAILTPKGVLLHIPNGDTCLLSLFSGSEKWSKKFPFLPCYLAGDMIVGYKNYTSKKLKGIRLNNGEEVWETAITHDGGWSNTQMIDEHSMYIIADNLCRLNLETGETNQLDCRAAINDGNRIFKTLAAGIGTGLTTGLLTGVGIYGYTIADWSVKTGSTICAVPSDGYHIFGLCSNILVDGTLNYFSDRSKMRCFNENMEVVWEVELPDSHSAGAYLIDRGETIMMINTGRANRPRYAFYGSGTPYVATFSKADGSVLSYEPFAEEKECVQHYSIDENGISMETKTKFAYKPFDGAIQVKERQD